MPPILRALTKAGVPAGVLIASVIPHIGDHAAVLDALVDVCRAMPANYVRKVTAHIHTRAAHKALPTWQNYISNHPPHPGLEQLTLDLLVPPGADSP